MEIFKKTYYFLQGKVTFERRRSETICVVASSLISVEASVAVVEELRHEKLFACVRVLFCKLQSGFAVAPA
jgi:hypothetical protein